jgi:glycosyl transferase family 25
MGERIDVSKSQGYSPNTILDEYRYEFTDILTKNPSFDYFKNIVYLNLEERTDRKKEIESELAKFNINAQHFNAFKVDLDEALKCMGNRTDLDEHSLKLAPSRVGASKSHIGAVQLAKDNNWDNVLILEDDVKFVDNAPYILEQALLELKDLPRWDVLYLGANSMDTIKQISGHVGELTAAFCNHAYVVNKHFYDTILNYNWNQYLITDQFYLDICRDTRYTTYTVLPIIATQKSSFSDIEGKEVNYEDVIKDSYKNTLNIFK